MNIFTTHAKKVLIFTIILTMLFTTLCYGSNIGATSDIEALIDKVCLERGVPSVLVKAIATLESGMQQFNSNGTPKISGSGNIGVMQVSNNYGTFNTEKLKYDTEYNINAGIDVLLTKWNSSVTNNSIPSVGNMDPNVLENWYFALWAYNGWVARNNPNYNANCYQNRIYRICSEVYGQSINYIDFSYLPSSGHPSRGLNVKTPQNINYANAAQLKVGDLISVNNIAGSMYLRYAPNGSYNFNVSSGQTAKITEGPVLNNGYYWYKVLVNDSTVGWIERNWIKKIGDSQYGIYPFEDIIYHWAAKSVTKLYNSGYINGNSDGKYYPDNKMTREDFCTLATRVMKLDSMDYAASNLRFSDRNKISSYAVDSIAELDNAGVLKLYGDELNPGYNITRGEIAYIVANYIINQAKIRYDLESATLGVERVFDLAEYFKLDSVAIPFNDVYNLTEWQINYVKVLYSLGIMNGVSANMYEYSGYIDRGTVAVVMDRLATYLQK